ncbi:MAG TPA: rhodanese-like domain-containing protein [Syntrophales bacterium]|nr:rhodanese-like domain-containing protein [Syntrophales bacterium]
MKKRGKFLSVLAGLILVGALAATASARELEPVVTTAWLEKNLDKVIVLDVRKVEEYRGGHIPGAVNVAYGSWAIKRGELLNELPADDDLRDVLGSAGIEPASKVVVVGKTATPADRVDATRVAWTLIYAGVSEVSLLSGGYDKWVADGKAVSTEAVRPRAKDYRGRFHKDLVVTKAAVAAALGKGVIVDVRERDFYEGKKKLPFVERLGHIKGAVSLPTSTMYEADGTYKAKDALAALAAAAVGADRDREIILYCDTGKFCTAWWFMMRELLGYKNVKVYDGSMMEWAKDPAAPMEP